MGLLEPQKSSFSNFPVMKGLNDNTPETVIELKEMKEEKQKLSIA